MLFLLTSRNSSPTFISSTMTQQTFEAAILELVLDKQKEQYTSDSQQSENRNRKEYTGL